MICPARGGTGEETRRLLWFFTWRRSCANCGGTGQVDALRAKKAPPIAAGYDDHLNALRDRTDDAFASSSLCGAHEHDNPSVDFGGGRSGGGGASASWGDEAGSRDAAAHHDPVIVDPFVADSPSSDASDAGSDDAGRSDDASAGSDDGGSDSDRSTSY